MVGVDGLRNGINKFYGTNFSSGGYKLKIICTARTCVRTWPLDWDMESTSFQASFYEEKS